MNLRKREEGASLIEYAVLVALLAVVCIVGMAALGYEVGEIYCNTASKFPDNDHLAWIDGECCRAGVTCGGGPGW